MERFSSVCGSLHGCLSRFGDSLGKAKRYATPPARRASDITRRSIFSPIDDDTATQRRTFTALGDVWLSMPFSLAANESETIMANPPKVVSIGRKDGLVHQHRWPVQTFGN
jgi:hypothetical protein